MRTKFAVRVWIEVKPSARAKGVQILKHVRDQVRMGSATLHGCHIKKVTVK